VSLNVLVTAGSRRVPLVRAFQRALLATGGGDVVVTDVNPLSPTVYVADRAYHVPMADDPAYIDALLAICRQERVGLLIPTIDDELTAIAEARDRFEACGTRVAVSPAAATAACNDKRATWRLLAEHGVEAAPTWRPDELPSPVPLPLFVKPRTGRGGVGAFPIRDLRELEFFCSYVDDPVLQPYLHGPEFTIDVLCDFDGQVLSVVPRERRVIRAGVVDRGCTVADPLLVEAGCRTARALKAIGAINVQCRIVAGRPVVFEVNPRFSGGIPLTIAAGADFPRMLVDLALGRRVAPRVGRYRVGLWMSSYESSVFVDEKSIGFSSTVAPARSEVA
jgi:carbamoyl-phosphate synthase large subunit